jgi:hypothetical protein
MDLHAIARGVFIAGVLLIVLGGILWLLAGSGIPLGRLPGDLRIERGGVSCFIPLASSIVVSLVLTLLINLVLRALK